MNFCNTSNTSDVDLSIGGMKTEQVNNVKFSGIYIDMIDEKIKWKSPLGNITSNV